MHVYVSVADPEMSKGGALERKGGGGTPLEVAKIKSRILGLKSCFLLTFDGNFRRKRGPGPPWPPLNPPLCIIPFRSVKKTQKTMGL
jgi:hypothetical protein